VSSIGGFAECFRVLLDGDLCGQVHQPFGLTWQSGAPLLSAHECRTGCESLLATSISFIGFSVGVHSVLAALLGSPGDEAFSTRSYWLLTQCGALAIGTTHCRAEAMRSLVSALRPVADRIHPCRKYTPKPNLNFTIDAMVDADRRYHQLPGAADRPRYTLYTPGVASSTTSRSSALCSRATVENLLGFYRQCSIGETVGSGREQAEHWR
jgi:hypothetical protein